MPAPVSVGELQRAYLAAQRGDFRELPPSQPWAPGPTERVLVVVGATGQAGTSTLALALAEATAATRLVDCAPTVASGLVGVCDRELGRDPSGWWQGHRGELLVQRSPLHNAAAADTCPTPLPLATGNTVLDAGFPVATVLAGRGWLADLLTDTGVPLVLVTRCTVPGMRRLAAALDLLAPAGRRLRVAVVGPSPRRWPRSVHLPPLPAGASPEDALVCVPVVDTVAVHGLDSHPLPSQLTSIAHHLLEEGTPS